MEGGKSPSLVEVLHSLRCIRVKADGDVADNFEDYKKENFALAIGSSINSITAIDRFKSICTPYCDRILSIRCRSVSEDAIQFLLNEEFFYKVIDLNLTYSKLSSESLNLLCNIVNPLKRLPIRRLNLSNCNLHYYGTVRLFQTRVGHSYVEEVIVTDNRCTDEALPIISKAVNDIQSKVNTLVLSGNDITDKGMIILYRIASFDMYPATTCIKILCISLLKLFLFLLLTPN